MTILSIYKSSFFKARYNVKLDNGLFFNISEKTLFDCKLEVDSIIDDTRLNLFIKDEYSFLETYSYNYFQKFFSSENEFKDKLYYKGFSHENIHKIISLLKETKIIDDYKYAELFIRDAVQKLKYSKREISNKLLKKKIHSDIIFNLLSVYYDEEVAEKTKKKIIAQKKSKYSPVKLKQYLYQKGFNI